MCIRDRLLSGDRSNEIRLRQNGLTYQDISNQGGGIAKTVNSTRNASRKELESIGNRNLSQSSHYGTTTIEAKSGYGLAVDSEIKILQATSSLN